MKARKVLRTSGAVVAFAIAFAPPAQAQVCVPGVTACPTPTPTPTPAPPAPDPGGQENPAVAPVDKPFGFNVGYPHLSGPIADDLKQQTFDALQDVGAKMDRNAMSLKWMFPPSAQTPFSAMMQAPFGQAPEDSYVDLLDEKYQELRVRGITPVWAIQDVPGWASTLYQCAKPVYKLQHGAECPDNWNDVNHSRHYPAPEFYGVWRQWVAWAAARYPEGVIEGPNEPDWVLYWKKTHPDSFPWGVTPEVAAQVQCELYQAASPVTDEPVGSASLSGGRNAVYADYMAKFVPAAKGCYDYFSFHPYPYGTPSGPDTFFGTGSGLAERFHGLRSAQSAAGNARPIWVTETGYHVAPTGNATTDAQKEQTYADATRRLYNRLATMPDVDAVMFHTLRDNPASTDAGERYYGFFRGDWSPKPRACYFVSIFGQTRSGC